MNYGRAFVTIALILVLVFALQSTQAVVAQAVYQARYGSPVDTTSQTLVDIDPNSTYTQAGQKYQVVQIFHASGFQGGFTVAGYGLLQGAQDVVNKVVQDAVTQIQNKEETPLYVHAATENMSCNFLTWCTYGIRVTSQFQAPAKAELIEILVIVIIIAIAIILAYLIYEGIQSASQFVNAVSNALSTYGYEILAIMGLVAVIIITAYMRRKQ